MPELPDVPGIRFRPYRGAQDHADLVRIENAQAEADGEPGRETVEGLAVELANLTDGDPSRDLLVAEVQGTPVAWTRVGWDEQTDDSRRYRTWGVVDPAWRGRGIGGALLGWDLARLREIGSAHEFHGDRWFSGWANDADAAGTQLLLDHGFRPVRQSVAMVRPTLDAIGLPPMPEGLEVRPVREADLRAVYQADCDAFRDHDGWIDDSEAAFGRWALHPLTDPSLMVVAWAREEVAGGALCAISPAENEANGFLRGWVETVFTRRAWRRRGLASSLLGQGLVRLRDRGMTSAQLSVSSTNAQRADRIYLAARFVPQQSTTIYRRDWD
ncbi:MAG: GNAT family N-acetyltransferase [Chloroflexota bacterium]